MCTCVYFTSLLLLQISPDEYYFNTGKNPLMQVVLSNGEVMYRPHIHFFFRLFLRFFYFIFPGCSADCPSLRLFIQSARTQCSVKPLRTTKPLHASEIVVAEENEGK